MPFCPNCGVECQPDASYCTICGRSLSDAPVGVMDAGTPQELPYYISLNRILLMTVLSYGLYPLYWFYLTWKQYRDHTGEEAYPVWHALTLFVPIYSLFRIHAHARTYRDLMEDAGSPGAIKAWLAVVLGLIAGMLNLASLRASFRPDALTQEGAVGIVIVDAIATALVIALLLHLQSNLNRYWQSRPNVRVRSARIGIGEIIFGIIGGLIWLSTLANIFSESWRTGF